jgi:RNA 2',3'-cyclic 3'-phosphodiesterase
MMEEEKLRSFIAIELPREAINYIKQLQELIRKQSLFTGKFTEPENLHLTLKFLGEIDKETLEKIKERLREVKYLEFEASLGEAGAFSKSFIKIVWLKLHGKVFELQKEVDEKLKGLFEPENRFMSHITIARVKKVGDKSALLDYLGGMKIKKITFKVDRIYLKKSTLKPEGPVYEDLEEIKLGQ